MDGATTAAEDGSAAYEEASKRADTAKGAIQRLKNNFNDLAITVGEHALPPLVGFTDKLVPLVTGLAETHPNALQVALAFGVLALVAGPLLTIVGSLVTLFGLLVSPIVILAGILTLGLLNNLDDFAGNLRDVRIAIEEGDLVGLLEGIVGALFDIPEGVAMAVLELAGVEDPKGGLKAWEGVLENIQTIVRWIGNRAGEILGSINFSIPEPIKKLWQMLSDIAGWLGTVTGLDGSGFLGGGGGMTITPTLLPAGGGGTHERVRDAGGPVAAGQPYYIGT
ncbi:MAG: phage tail tape measure protein, partial [Anaerolineae bacterium]|nr:phage tail tape measure protein [Anaerolineae bacterium]